MFKDNFKPLDISMFSWVLFILLALLFFFFPSIDTATSNLFFINGSWIYSSDGYSDFVYFYGEKITASLALALLGAWIITLVKKDKFGETYRKFGYALLALLLGPVLFVNGVLKTFIGRARPRDTVEFGEDMPFTRAFDIFADSCADNCSFVCGHCSAGFYIITLAPLFSGYKRHLVLWFGLFWGASISLGRLIDGAHFISDATFALIFTYIAGKIAYKIYPPIASK